MRNAPQHHLRRALTDELHARPFAPITAPAEMLYYAFAPETGAADRSSAADLAHLNMLLAHLGAPELHKAEGARTPNHHEVEIADIRIKWERHTEFVSITLTAFGARDKPFDPWLAERVPQAWLDAAPGPALCATMIHIEAAEYESAAEEAVARLSLNLVPSSTAQASITDGEALALGDFRIDANGYVRFALIGVAGIGPRRLGRVAQRLLEIETYRTMAMLALPEARRLGPRLGAVERDLSEIVAEIARPQEGGPVDPEAQLVAERATLDRLTEIAAELERMKAATAFRFDAARAYETLVWERLEALREERLDNRQLFTEFMVRRFKPAMRTCAATAARLDGLSDRVSRAANLLRTQVDVTLESQNQKLLESMDRRAQLQLRLQETVEGLSVVAISYYAVGLVGYALEPLGESLGLGEKGVKAALVVPVVLLVWFFLRSVKRRIERLSGE